MISLFSRLLPQLGGQSPIAGQTHMEGKMIVYNRFLVNQCQESDPHIRHYTHFSSMITRRLYNISAGCARDVRFTSSFGLLKTYK